jgi:carbonic anhydrase
MVRFFQCLFATIVASMCASAAAGLCESGQRQSPIDIRQTQRETLPPLKANYQTAPLKLGNDGHTVRVRFEKGSTLSIGHEHFTLQQFHFHTPGGDKIAGEEFPMAAHLLHKRQDGKLLAVVVLFRTGRENALLQNLLPLIPASKGPDRLIHGSAVNATQLLPANLSYFRYAGSVTAPPCTEGVEWIVVKQPLELSPSQLTQYRQVFADNARPVQPLHQRTVLESL